MRKILRYLNIALMLVLFAGIMGSCVKDKFSAEEGTANIIVKLDSRADVSASEDENALSNEGIKNVRLILVQKGKVIFNDIFEYNDASSLSKGFEIKDIKAEKTDFYAIVNVNNDELGKLSKGKNFDENSLNLLLEGFPREYTSETLLPMYGENTGQYINNNNKNIDIRVTRAVARIDLYINNQTGASLGINQIDFGDFIANKGYLISSEGKSDIEYKEVSFEVKDSKEYHFYLYEAVKVPYTNFKIGMNKGKYALKQIDVKDEESRKNLLKRNTVLKIAATVNKTEDETCATIECSVAPWEAVDLDPTFE